MNGVDPYAYMQQVAMRMNEMNSRQEIATVLDELEYLFEVTPPDPQDNVEALMAMRREKLKNGSQ